MKPRWVKTASLIVMMSAPLLFGCGIDVPQAAYTCTDGSVEERGVIRSVSVDILQKLATGQHQVVWDMAHPALKGTVSQSQFLEAANYAQARIPDIQLTAVRDVKLLKVTGPANSSLQANCGSADANSAAYLRVVVPPRTATAAVSLTDLPGARAEWAASMLLVQEGGDLRLASMNVPMTKYKGRGFRYYADLADSWTESGHVLSGYVAYQMADALSSLATSIESGENLKVRERVRALAGDSRLQSEFKNWPARGETYSILYSGVIETLSDISMHVKYLTQRELTEQAIQEEAGILMRRLEERYPELSAATDAVLFEAYNEVPSDPNRNYSGYRAVKWFKPGN